MERHRAGSGLSPSALIGTQDPVILEALEQQVAAAGLGIWQSATADETARLWSRAAVVLLDPVLATQVLPFAPGRRAQVVLVTDRPVTDSDFRVGFELGAESVVHLAEDAGWLSEFLITAADPPVSPGRLVGVIGGSGGTGVSTLVAALGQAAARGGERAVVIDLDPRGPGLDRVLGFEELSGARWPTLQVTSGRLSPAALRASLPEQGGLSCVAWGEPAQWATSAAERDPRTVREVLRAARAGHDWVFVDLPREADPLLDELLDRCDQVLMVVQPDFTGLSAAVHLLSDRGFADQGFTGAGGSDRALRLVVRRRRGGLEAGAVSRLLGQPTLVELPECRGLQEAIALQQGPLGRRTNYARAVFRLLAQLEREQVAA